MGEKELINNFYTAFQNKDYRTMQGCYDDSAIFSDQVFINLNAKQVRAMWEMFCVNSKDLRIEFKNVSANERRVSAEWTAFYTFPSTGRKVINHIKSDFLLERGKITKHIDTFNFYKSIKQSLGIVGLLFGWTPLVKNRLRNAAMKRLNYYMSGRNTTTDGTGHPGNR